MTWRGNLEEGFGEEISISPPTAANGSSVGGWHVDGDLSQIGLQSPECSQNQSPPISPQTSYIGHPIPSPTYVHMCTGLATTIIAP